MTEFIKRIISGEYVDLELFECISDLNEFNFLCKHRKNTVIKVISKYLKDDKETLDMFLNKYGDIDLSLDCLEISKSGAKKRFR